jgi:hypothetical protein
MAARDKLLLQSINGPANFRFEDLCRLGEEYGFVHERTTGSHHWYKREGYRTAMNFQRRADGKAVAYQVRDLLKALRELGEIE